MASLIGRKVGNFVIEALIGRGAMAQVFKAIQQPLQRPVALKILQAGVFTPQETIDRFLREARAIARLNHPNIVQVFEVGSDSNIYYFAMTLVNGPTLASELRDGPLPVVRSLDIAISVADALDFAHKDGLIHRDVKPSNILLDGDRLYLTDFGLARPTKETTLTATGAMLGTPSYMSPEQASRGKTTFKTDVFSAGVVLYEMLTGKNPFAFDLPRSDDSSKDVMALIDKISRGSFPAPDTLRTDIPPDVNMCVVQAMESDAGRRPSAGEWRDALRKARTALGPNTARSAALPPGSA